MKFICQLLLMAAFAAVAADRPNILWITAEDMSPTLGCYGDAYAITPNLDQLAAASTRYTRAFATAPACSPSRACLINGVYAPTQGTHNMRSAYPIPAEMTGFPALLRTDGYYTGNNVKTDYNSGNADAIIAASWDECSAEAHWRKRPAGRPFFTIFNLMTSHQSRTMVWPYEQFVGEVQSKLTPAEIHDPAKAPLPPYYPEDPIVRRTIARFYDCVTAMDKEVGAILAQLDADGLADDTIVFFYSDHGSGMPRHKRALLDSGMQVAMLVRFPEKWRHLAPTAPGATTDRLINFVDFGPTVLSLAGSPQPDWMQGEPFLGKAAATPRQYVFGHRDRIDEVVDMARSARDGRYLYIRNYMPHLGYNQITAWPDLGEVRHAIYRATDRRTMTDAQWQFVGPTRPPEELYDCQDDPLNLHNLAAAPEHAPTLARLRQALVAHIESTLDLGFIPEAQLWELAGKGPAYEWAKSAVGAVLLRHAVAAAALVGSGTEVELIGALQAGEPAVRYWGGVGLTAAASLSPAAVTALEAALNDESPAVRIQAADALLRHTASDAAMQTLGQMLAADNLAVALQAARTVELLGGRARSLLSAMQQCDRRMKTIRPPGTSAVIVDPVTDMAMFIGFATDTFIRQIGDQSAWQSLFDGKSTDGWQPQAKGEVTAANGEMKLFSNNANLWVTHALPSGDFELQVEAMMPATTYNSGVAFRCTSGPKIRGYQAEIDGSKSGAIYSIGQGWVLPAKADAAGWSDFAVAANSCFREGQWNHFRIRCQGDRIQIWVNDHQTADIQDTRFSSGTMALQHHGRGDAYRFRNIFAQSL